MAKVPSDATKLRAALRDLREARETIARLSTDAAHYRARATKAEQEVREWKERFTEMFSLLKTKRKVTEGG